MWFCVRMKRPLKFQRFPKAHPLYFAAAENIPLAHHQVFAALGNAGVKGNVVFNMPVSVTGILLHPLTQPAQRLYVSKRA